VEFLPFMASNHSPEDGSRSHTFLNCCEQQILIVTWIMSNIKILCELDLTCDDIICVRHH
jgi:hypothetical protein